ncbi:MAG: glycyl-radical enzyme activating protein [Bacteroidales bacterium]|nr:glycyl-radical enzyme activating protein [Bacteroidales bacterium]
MKHSGLIFNIQRFSLHDGPGIRTTVFFQGCPLNCSWCHNPEGKPAGTEKKGNKTIGQAYSTADLLEIILKDRDFYEESGGGVTFSGGEPLSQWQFLSEISGQCRKKGIHTAIDTSGYAGKEITAAITGKADLFLYDLKLIDPVDHLRYTGVSCFEILQNLKFLLSKGQKLRLRFPMIPGITTTEKNLSLMAEFVGSLKENPPLDLLPWHKLAAAKHKRSGSINAMEGVNEMTEDEKMAVKTFFISHGINAAIIS